MRLRSSRLTAIANSIRNLFYGTTLDLRLAGADRLDPRITFSRTSNATLTGSNGLIQYAPHNLLTYSEQFDNAAWTKTNATITANATTAPNGTITADKLVATTATGAHYINAPVVSLSSPATASVYAKAGEYGWLFMQISGSGSNAYFNLSAGTVGSSTDCVATIQSVGDGWYRCAIADSTVTNPVVVLWPTTGNSVSSYTGDGTSGIYIWGAQLEIGSTATTYNPTTVKNLLGYTQEFDNAAWTKSNSFVQTNLLTYSEQFDNAAWTKTRISVSANAVIAPDGTITADKLVEDTTASASHFTTSASASFTSGTAYTFSAYAKAGERSQFGFNMQSTVAGVDAALFNLATGSVIQNGSFSSTSITPVGNGWYRCTGTITATGTASAGVIVRLALDTATSYTGDGTSGIYIWGAQLVQGSVAGDYQVTTAAAAAVQYAGPFGYLSAEKLVEDATNNSHRVRQTVTTISSPQTFSVYAKAGERSWVYLVDASITNGFCYFNLATGAKGTQGANAVGNIVSVGNGWYRCSIQVTLVGGGDTFDIRTATADGTNAYTGDGTSGIYIFGAQLSDSASLDPYVYNPVAAPAAAAYYGPRFDYDPVTLAPKGLLIEEQRTNLLTYSEQFDHASWSKGAGVTVTANATTAPSGSLTADNISFATGGEVDFLRKNVTLTVGAAYTVTVYARLISGSPKLVIDIGNGGGSAALTVTSEWQRFSYSFTYSAGNQWVDFEANAPGTIALWGAQLEAGAFATSYIPTVASQVTRAADSAIMQGTNFSQWYNQTEGTLYVSAESTGNSTSAKYVVGINDGSASNIIGIANDRSRVVVAGTASADFLYGSVDIINFAASIAYKVDSFACAKDGALIGTDSSGAVPVVNQMAIGDLEPSTNRRMSGTIKRIAYFPRRLSNSELQSITA